jgi:hypothetical protein
MVSLAAADSREGVHHAGVVGENAELFDDPLRL